MCFVTALVDLPLNCYYLMLLASLPLKDLLSSLCLLDTDHVTIKILSMLCLNLKTLPKSQIENSDLFAHTFIHPFDKYGALLCFSQAQ